MPFSAIDCSNDELLQAIRAHEESLGEILLNAREQLKALDTQGAALDEQLLKPLTITLDQILASAGVTSADLIKAGGLVTGGTRQEIEKSVTNAGLSMVNGRVLVTRGGDVDISGLKLLHKFVGSMEKVKALLPDISACNSTADVAAGLNYKSRFILIATTQKTEVIPSVGCKAETVVFTEEVVGIEIPIEQILMNRPDLIRANLTLYIFWIGPPDARQSLKDRALVLGLTEDEFIDAVLKNDSENLRIYVLAQPKHQICSFTNYFGPDTDAVLTNGFSENTPPVIKLYPTPEEVLAEIDASGIFRGTPGKVSSNGMEDFGCISINCLAALDDNKAPFDAKKNKDKCLEASAALHFMDSYFEAFNKAMTTFNTLVAEMVQKALNKLNELTAKMGLVKGLFGDFLRSGILKCIFPAGIGLKYPLDSQHFQSLISLLINTSDTVTGFLFGMDSLLNLLSNLGCITFSLASLIPSRVAAVLPGVSCIANTFSFDACFKVALDIGAVKAALALQALNHTLSFIRNLIVTFSSMVLNLPGTAKKASCLPPETALLITKLGLRSAASSAGFSYGQ
jgi:hypothetical protein